MKKIYLKYKLKRLYIRIQKYPMHGCGLALQMAIDNRFYNLLKKFNETADKLTKLDPECPKFRYNLNP